jgi:SET domain-containing protein
MHFHESPDGVVTSQCESWVSVRESSVPGIGLGVYADRLFKRGDLLGVYTGAIRQQEETLENGRYAMAIDNEMVIDASVGGNWTRYINDGRHGFSKSKVNAKCYTDMEIRATRRIYPGDEIFISYGAEYWEGGQNEADAALPA